MYELSFFELHESHKKCDCSFCESSSRTGTDSENNPVALAVAHEATRDADKASAERCVAGGKGGGERPMGQSQDGQRV